VLSVLDRKWREHLYEMDYLREGIGLRGWAQRDPLVEYQREGYDMFNSMMDGIKEESVTSLFNFQVQVQQDPVIGENGDGTATAQVAFGTAPGGAIQPGQGQPGQRQPGQGPPGQGQPGQPQPGRGEQGGQAQQRSRRGRAAAANAPADGQQIPAGLTSAPGLARPQRPGQLSYSAPSEDGSGTAEHHTASGRGGPDFAKVGRNAPCPCGSGKKFKVCHGDPRNR